MGEPADGVAIIWRLHAGDEDQLQDEGGCDRVRGEAGIRVVRAGATREAVRAQGVRKQLPARTYHVEAYQDEVNDTRFRCASWEITTTSLGPARAADTNVGVLEGQDGSAYGEKERHLKASERLPIVWHVYTNQTNSTVRETNKNI